MALCAVAIALTTAGEASAATAKKKQVASKNAVATQPRARIRVERRSFLDAGTETLPGDRKFIDYAFPPNYSPIGEALGPGKDYRRRPLLDPWDFPGASSWW